MVDLNKPMNSKICMVTGATSGIGKMIAKMLAQQGARVIVVGRNAEKSAATVNQIKQQTGNPAVQFMLADLSSQKEIHQLVHQFQSRHQHLHVLVNDAAALFLARQQSVDGIEMTFALNHLAYFLLTNLLLDTLKASAPARIVNISARLHKGARINFDDLQNQKRYMGLRAYKESKLANVLFTYDLARRLEGTGVTVNALEPEVVAFARMFKRLTNMYPPFTSPEQGAQTAIYLATSPEVGGVTGKYFAKKKAVPSSQASYDEATARRLWQVSAELSGLSVSTWPHISKG